MPGTYELGEAVPMKPEARAEPTNAFDITDLSVTYRDGRTSVTPLRDLNLTVPSGQLLCLLGPSGQGKSTLLRCMAGLLTATSGTLLAHGRPVTGPGADRGLVFQGDAIPPWLKVRDNVSFGPRLRGVPREQWEPRVDHFIEAVGLQDRTTAWPRQLSGGMRKRVAVAAVFANDADTLLMDEPFGSLDYFTRSNLHKILLKLWQETQKTIVFVTHDVDEALTLADRIVVLRDGQVATDTPVPFTRPRGEELRSNTAANHLRHELLAVLGDAEPGTSS